MPIQYRVLEGENLILIHSSGVITDRELRLYREQLNNDPRWGEGVRELLDHRQLQEVQVTGTAVRSLVELDRSFWLRAGETGRGAAVAQGDAPYGLTRMYLTLTEEMPGERRVFREMAPARAWLGLDPEQDGAVS